MQLRRQVAAFDSKIRRLADLAAGSDVAARLLRAMGEIERERAAAAAELASIDRELATHRGRRQISERDVREALRSMAGDVAVGRPVPEIRDQLMQLLERVELDPAAPGEVLIHYRVPELCGGASGAELASPRGTDTFAATLELSFGEPSATAPRS